MSYTLASWILPSVGIDPLRPAGQVPPIWVAAVILVSSMAICGAVGFTIERLAYRPLRKSPRLNVLITAIGVSLLLQNLGQLNVTIQDIPLIGHPLNWLLQMIPGVRAITTQHFGFGAIPQRMPDLLPNWELLRVSLPNGDGTRNDVVFGLVDAMIIGASAVLMIALQYLIFRTKIGRAMRAVSFDFDAAALMGIPVDRIVSFTFVLGSVLAAAAGFLVRA